jgi:hypothetical protein
LPAGLAGTIQAQIVDEEPKKPQQIEEGYRFPAEITWRVNFSRMPRLELISWIR